MFFSFFTDIGRPLQYGRTKNVGFAAKKECFNIQYSYYSAIENYNMDNSEMIKTALPGYEFENLELKLVKMKYLKEPLKWPNSDCSYGYIVDSDSSDVFCKKHGKAVLNISSDDKPIIPKYDQSLEKPFSKSYKELKENNIRNTIFQSKFGNFLLNTFSSLLFTIPFFICICISIELYFKKNN